MPVTAKLSRQLHERLGTDIATELVEWFNTVDTRFENQLRDLNESNWQRFRSELDARFAASDVRLEVRFAAVDTRFAAIDARFDILENKLGNKIDGLASVLRAEIATAIASSESKLIKWMFGFWTAAMVSLAGILVALTQPWRP